MIAGYERPSQVRAMLVGLEREKASVKLPGHMEAIDASIALFTDELTRMEADGTPEEPEPGNPAMGRLSWLGFRGVPPSVAG